MDKYHKFDVVWAKTILQAARSTIEAGGKLPVSIIPIVYKAIEIMKKDLRMTK